LGQQYSEKLSLRRFITNSIFRTQVIDSIGSSKLVEKINNEQEVETENLDQIRQVNPVFQSNHNETHVIGPTILRKTITTKVHHNQLCHQESTASSEPKLQTRSKDSVRSSKLVEKINNEQEVETENLNQIRQVNPVFQSNHNETHVIGPTNSEKLSLRRFIMISCAIKNL
jgi:phosphotransferase system IIB component